MLPTKALYSGHILDLADFQLKDGDTPRLHADGTPEMGVRIVLGRDDAVQTLWASGYRLAAIVKAVKDAGATDLELGGYLAGNTASAPAFFEAAYARP